MFLLTLMLVLTEILPVLQALFWTTPLMETLRKPQIKEMLRRILETLHYPHLELFYVILHKRNSKKQKNKKKLENKK